jgi:hypothetical protein
LEENFGSFFHGANTLTGDHGYYVWRKFIVDDLSPFHKAPLQKANQGMPERKFFFFLIFPYAFFRRRIFSFYLWIL